MTHQANQSADLPIRLVQELRQQADQARKTAQQDGRDHIVHQIKSAQALVGLGWLHASIHGGVRDEPTR